MFCLPLCLVRVFFLMSKQNERVYYAVGVGRVPGVYHSWSECKVQIDGVSSPRYRKFFGVDEARNFVEEWKHKSEQKRFQGNGQFSPEASVIKREGASRIKSVGDGSPKQFSRTYLKGDKKFYKQYSLPNGFDYQTEVVQKKRRQSLGDKEPNLNKNCIYLTGTGYSQATVPRSKSLLESPYFSSYKCFSFLKRRPKEFNAQSSQVLTLPELCEAVRRGNNASESSVYSSKKNGQVSDNLVGVKEGPGRSSEDDRTCVEMSRKSVINPQCDVKSNALPCNVRSVQSADSSTQTAECNFRELIGGEIMNLEKHEESLKTLSASLISKIKGCNVKNTTGIVECVMSFVPLILKQITAGIVDGLRAGESNEPPRTGTQTNSPGKEQREPESFAASDRGRKKLRFNGILEEKLGKCEERIELVFDKCMAVLSELREIKNEFRTLVGLAREDARTRSNDGDVDSIPDEFSTEASSLDNHNTTSDLTSNKKMVPSTAQEMDDSDDSYPDIEKGKRKRKYGDLEEKNMKITGNEFERAEIKKEASDLVGFTVVEDDYVVVYTDGACTFNGSHGAKAGIGIWFGDDHPLNVAKPVNGVATNNNAEIQAARIAIELALNVGITKLKICTDSEFLINCATSWMPRWKKKGWLTYEKKPVKNRKELEKLDRVMSQLSVRWEKVAAHCGIHGNEMADKLANIGASEYVKVYNSEDN